jgi:sulfate transport system ATP-binding protein
MSIQIEGVSKAFGSSKALEKIDLEVKSGELLALLGPSGCGKTTLLRIIAGLERPDSGSIKLHDTDATKQSAQQRRVGFVFQHYALFRHMSVFENVAFGLRVRPSKTRPSKEDIRLRVTELLRLVQLESFSGRYPSQLSGGQRQRVALARALAVEPSVLLLDEPFGALDAQVRQELRQWLRRLHDELHITSVFVTHDQEEALEVADRIVVMNKGMIEQIGTPEEVYEHPGSPFVYSFLGRVNLFHSRREHVSETGAAPAAESAGEGEAVLAYVRPHDVHIARHRNGEPTIAATVRHINSVGPVVRVELQREDTGDLVTAELTRDRYRELALKAGETVQIKAQNARIFEEDYSI